MRATMVSLAGFVFALGGLVTPVWAVAQNTKAPCKMSDPDVHLTADGWAGPNCVTTQAGSDGTPPAASAGDSTRHSLGDQDDAEKGSFNRNRIGTNPLCKMGDPGVELTADGWSGPDCISSKDAAKQARRSERSRSKPLCKMSDPGVELTADGWSGPDCISSKDGVRPTHDIDLDQGAERKPLCHMKDAGVHLTSDGWSGPNCISSQDGKTPTHPGDLANSQGSGQSCLRSEGSARANEMVRQCKKVSTATHPPCNVENSCSTIRDEIRRGCAILTSGVPQFCDDYR